jgi:hypothetical protein
LSNGLDKLYIGLGNGTDFIMYPNKGLEGDTAISMIPVLGWKWKVIQYLMIEPFLGWKFYLIKTNNYENIGNYLDNSFQWGLNIKLFLPNK